MLVRVALNPRRIPHRTTLPLSYFNTNSKMQTGACLLPLSVSDLRSTVSGPCPVDPRVDGGLVHTDFLAVDKCTGSKKHVIILLAAEAVY